MKKMKKLFAVLLAFAMVMGMSLTTFAADGIVGNSDDTGAVTVAGVEKDVTVKVYPIAMADYDDATGNFVGYTNPYNLNDIKNPTQSELSAIAARNDLGEGTTLTWNGTVYTKSEMPVGMYLVCVTGSETSVYNVAVVSVNYVNEDGVNQIAPGSVTMVESGATWVKKSGQPSVDKYIVEGENHLKGNTVNIGDDVNYEITIDPIPNYGGNYPVLNVVDTLEDSLSFNNDLVVKVVTDATDDEDVTLVKDTHYTLSVEGQVITVDFAPSFNYKLNDYVGEKIVISYSAKLTGETVDLNKNDDANVNTAVLTYSKDSKTNNNNGTETINTYTATFDVSSNVTKVGEDNKALAGAVFEIFTDATCTTTYSNERISNTQNVNGTITGYLTTDAEGKLKLEGLDEGTYYLKEIAAPDGYSVNTTVYEIKITATHAEDGKLASYSVETKVAGSNDAATEDLTIVNTKLSALPSTGGIGTAVFTIGGCAIMIAAAYFFFVSRKKEA